LTVALLQFVGGQMISQFQSFHTVRIHPNLV
jgi:hypothetical protein